MSNLINKKVHFHSLSLCPSLSFLRFPAPSHSISLSLSIALSLAFVPLQAQQKLASTPITFITLDPGHFHAALVQKKMLADVEPTVFVYAPDSSDLVQHLTRIGQYNSRKDNPTRWNEKIYTGKDYFKKMLAEKKGNVVVISGNNQKKSKYILQCIRKGMHVFADKPMAIDKSGFRKLQRSFRIAQRKGLLLYDIMTERFEINTLLQRQLSMMPSVFGQLEKGSEEDPAITKESVHHLYKFVSEKPLVRPAWFLDTRQQGEGLVDVMTHLVDLVQWECFPESVINYPDDIRIYAATRWPTPLNKDEFRSITQQDNHPAYLLKDLQADSTLHIYCNGEIRYTLKGVHVKTSVTWKYKALPGTGDTHYSMMRGTQCNLVIRQSKEENFQPVLYIEPTGKNLLFEESLHSAFKQLESTYEGISLQASEKGWKVLVPEKWKEDHESHFSRVTERFLQFLRSNEMPSWEIPNMLAKYYTTTHALTRAKRKKGLKS